MEKYNILMYIEMHNCLIHTGSEFSPANTIDLSTVVWSLLQSFKNESVNDLKIHQILDMIENFILKLKAWSGCQLNMSFVWGDTLVAATFVVWNQCKYLNIEQGYVTFYNPRFYNFSFEQFNGLKIKASNYLKTYLKIIY